MFYIRLILVLLTLAYLSSTALAKTPQLPVFTYQGRLMNGGVPVNGTADFSARVWDSPIGGFGVSGILNYSSWPVIDGLFTMNMNFGGNVFNGESRYLEITVNGVTLTPRTLIAHTPYALQTRGMFYNETEDFLGIGRENRITTSEIFGLYKPGAGFGGMYVETDAGGRPFYGYAAGGTEKAFHYFDDADDRWKLQVGFQVFEFTTSGELMVPGQLGIGVDPPTHALHVEGSEGSLVFTRNDLISGSTIVAIADGAFSVGINGVANGEGSKAIRGIANNINSWAGYFEGKTYVQNILAVGTTNPRLPLHVFDAVSSTATVTNHIAMFENSSTGTSPDVLAIKVNSSDLTPGSAINFITFFNDAESSLGSIQGNGLGGVEFAGPGNDYAEWLEHVNDDEMFEPGDVVGVIGGKISKTTEGADQIMAISTQPIVVGNRPREDDEGLPGWQKIAFIGQAPVRVRGIVSSGDFLIPSGLNDGIATAIAPDAITTGQLSQVFATAWESTFSEGVSLVNAAIGIDQAAASAQIIETLHSHQLRQQRNIESMQQELAQIKAALQHLLDAEGESR